jgi:hypothetical protein
MTTTCPAGPLAARSSLSLAASAVHRIYLEHAEIAALDAGFDAGEFSGPAHADAAEREIDAALTRLGWTRETYNTEIGDRTSARFAFFSGLQVDEQATS